MMEIGGEYDPQFTGEYPPALEGHGTTFPQMQQPGDALSPSNPGVEGLVETTTLLALAGAGAGAFGGYRMTEDRPGAERFLATLIGLIGGYAVAGIGISVAQNVLGEADPW